MAVTTSWRGALEFAGFPVNVKLYSRRRNRSSDSFKTIAPDGHPVRSVYIDQSDQIVDRATTRAGVQVGDAWKTLSDEALAQVKSGNRSGIIEPVQFCPLEQVPLELALNSYAIVPDEQVPGAEQACGVIYNGLYTTGLCYCSDLTVTTGGRDSILVVWADINGMWGAALPYENELNPIPTYEYVKDRKQAQLFKRYVDQEFEPTGFDHGAHTSQYAKRRASAIASVMSGKKVKAPKEAPKTKVPDLVAALEKVTKGKAA